MNIFGPWYLYAVMTVTSPMTHVAEYHDEATCWQVARSMDAENAKRGIPAWQRPIMFCLPVSVD